MGTQQILVLVLSIIIVGVGVSVGIYSFQNQAFNANRSAVAAEMQLLVKESVLYWKTPVAQGGAGSVTDNIVIADLAATIGFQTYRGGPYNGSFGSTSENGDFIVVGMQGEVLILKGLGHENKAGKRPLVQMNLNMNTFICKTTFGEAEGF